MKVKTFLRALHYYAESEVQLTATDAAGNIHVYRALEGSQQFDVPPSEVARGLIRYIEMLEAHLPAHLRALNCDQVRNTEITYDY